MKEKVLEKFLRYISIDTASDPESESQPSTSRQLDLSRVLVKELREMGIKDVELDEWGYVMATIPSNMAEGENIPVIGFIAHVDTAPDASGANIRPRIIENYDGNDIVINSEKGFVMKVEDFPELEAYKERLLLLQTEQLFLVQTTRRALLRLCAPQST